MALCISPSSAVFSRQLQASRPQRLRSVAVRADGAKINGTIRLDEAKVVDNITADSAKPVRRCSSICTELAHLFPANIFLDLKYYRIASCGAACCRRAREVIGFCLIAGCILQMLEVKHGM